MSVFDMCRDENTKALVCFNIVSSRGPIMIEIFCFPYQPRQNAFIAFGLEKSHFLPSFDPLGKKS
jgi:hypothetical protein